MDSGLVQQVRRFNRAVTQRIGVLDDRYLARDRPLGEARVLWEIGEQGCDVRTLRSRLDLDSGYLSRLLRSLEADHLVTVGPQVDDRRVRTVRLTPAGARERAVLDRRSDALVRSLLEPLSESQRERLVSAMDEVERLLTAALVEVEVRAPSDERVQRCLGAYFAEIDRRFDGGFDPALSLHADLRSFEEPAGAFLLASLRGEPIGCGGVTFEGPDHAVLKRMWVAPAARGLGVGRRLLDELEAIAAVAGRHVVRLETNRALTEAISMYRSAGYVETERFNDEPYGHHWFEKHLGT